MEEAMKVFMKKHCGEVMPPEFFKSFGFSKEDDTVGMTMWVPISFSVPIRDYGVNS
jgi:hypothetical protein